MNVPPAFTLTVPLISQKWDLVVNVAGEAIAAAAVVFTATELKDVEKAIGTAEEEDVPTPR